MTSTEPLSVIEPDGGTAGHDPGLSDDELLHWAPSLQVTLEVVMARTAQPVGGLSTVFANNIVAGSDVVVLPLQTVTLHGISGAAAGTSEFDYVLPLGGAGFVGHPFQCQTIVWKYSHGRNLTIARTAVW